MLVNPNIYKILDVRHSHTRETYQLRHAFWRDFGDVLGLTFEEGNKINRSYRLRAGLTNQVPNLDYIPENQISGYISRAQARERAANIRNGHAAANAEMKQVGTFM